MGARLHSHIWIPRFASLLVYYLDFCFWSLLSLSFFSFLSIFSSISISRSGLFLGYPTSVSPLCCYLSLAFLSLLHGVCAQKGCASLALGLVTSRLMIYFYYPCSLALM